MRPLPRLLGLSRRRPVAAASLLAAAVAAFTHCLGSALAGSQPFGTMNRNVNDLGTQFVPFHAHLWDVLHGRADGGWLINWQSGYGSSFLPDMGTYLSSPFAFLVALFPREQIDLAVYVSSVARIATAAAVMAWLLMTMRGAWGARGASTVHGSGASTAYGTESLTEYRGKPLTAYSDKSTAADGDNPSTAYGGWWLAGALGAAYALCGWSVIEASYNPMWLDGLIAFPLLCLVGEWVRTGRRLRVWFGGGVLLVALVWVANFYTAYMATVGAGLVLVARLLMDGGPVRDRLRTVLRAGAAVALGIGVSAPVLFTVFAGTRRAYPGMGLTFRQAGWGEVLARLLPGTYGFSSPAMYVTALVLVLAFALPFHRRVAARVRVGWCALAVAVLVSMQWGPTHLAWHAFAEPNGSPYRQTFVLSGVLVMAAWVSLSGGAHVSGGAPGSRGVQAAREGAAGAPLPGRWSLAGGVGCLVLVGVVGAASPYGGRWVWLGAGAGLVAVVGGLVLLRSGARGRRWYVVGAAVLLIGCTVGQSALTTAWAAKRRVATQDDHAPYGVRQVAQSRTIAAHDDWPRHRTDPGRAQTVHNDAMVVGGQGASYYSSMTSAVLTRTLGALGDGWNGSGRAPHSLDNPVTDALFGVGVRLRSTYRQGADAEFTVVRREAAPLVTVRSGGGGRVRFGRSAFANQELLLGAKVYERLSGTAGSCTAGAPVFLWAPGFKGTARLAATDAKDIHFDAKRGRVRAPMQQLGVAGTDGSVRVALTGSGKRGAEVACLREDRLSAAVRELRAAGAVSVEVGDGSVRAVFAGAGRRQEGGPAGPAAGTAVLAVPRIAGWQCAADGGDLRPADSYLGLIAVPLGGGAREIRCEFRPPGLRAGLAVGVGSVGLMGVVGAMVTLRGKRRAGRVGGGTSAATGGPTGGASGDTPADTLAPSGV
ncbi:YfhO family protein [Streptomyces sp. NPDC051561]|uniref:YfhO family protein n=1 Tax=Streptomyces sp. NPDC051561 TaxID=3365658 RepID=UPI0037BC4F2D